MHELAPAGSKTKGGSIVFMGVTAGILMGIIVAMIVNAAIPRGETACVCFSVWVEAGDGWGLSRGGNGPMSKPCRLYCIASMISCW